MDVSIYFHRRKKKKERKKCLGKTLQRREEERNGRPTPIPIFSLFLFSYFSKRKKICLGRSREKIPWNQLAAGHKNREFKNYFFIPLSFRRPKKVGRDGFHSFSPPPPPRNPHFPPLLLFIIVMGRAHHLLILLSLYYKPRHQRGHTSIQKRWGVAKSIRVGNSTI